MIASISPNSRSLRDLEFAQGQALDALQLGMVHWAGKWNRLAGLAARELDLASVVDLDGPALQRRSHEAPLPHHAEAHSP